METDFKGKRKICLTIQYDGTNYHGWQIQPKESTIQGTIEEKLLKITGAKTGLVASGRTDSSVHAFGQIAAFFTESKLSAHTFLKALNALLPRDIRIIDVINVQNDFHPRYSVRKKRYFYIIHNEQIANAFLYKYSWHVKHQLNISSISHAAEHLKGMHDFKSFSTFDPAIKTTVREIYTLEIKAIKELEFMDCAFKGTYIKITVEADGFLRHMVRNIVGTLVSTGLGKIEPDHIKTILAKKDRRAAGPKAPPNGLFLEKVFY